MFKAIPTSVFYSIIFVLVNLPFGITISILSGLVLQLQSNNILK
ncbi:hypothetical protein BN1195_00479 [Chryseobacterium oranimense G311]|nr:hypothetical protein BN1195_00479 [Chryseobacterium oranimense G311]